MFNVGDRVVVIADDPLYGELGEVVKTFTQGFVPESVHVLLDEGVQPLWFDAHEIRKVEQA